ncbi:MAG TPA: hypothetical protein VL860_03350, partial [Planctomycetota bacterium]|nr:hypothetical protein [Planctomycetota bacterium]
DLRHLLEWALVLTAMLLVSPYTERTHYAAMMPALTLLIARGMAALHRPAEVTGWVSYGGTAAAVVAGLGFAMYFNLLTPPFLPDSVYLWFAGFHGYVVGGIGLFVALAVWLVREQRRADATPAIGPATT